MIDWEKLRAMMRKDLSRFISQDKLTDKDYCDLKLILSNLERSYTNEMFENDERLYSEGYSGSRNGHRVATRGRSWNNEYYNDMSGRSYGYYEDMPYEKDRYDNQYSGHSQEDVFKSKLQAMAHTAEDANTRRVIMEAINKLR